MAVVPVQVDGAVVYLEATTTGAGHQDVGITDALNVDEFRDAIVGFASAIKSGMVAVAPDKATVEFGVEATLTAGKLTALIAKGSGTANIKVTLEWSSDPTS